MLSKKNGSSGESIERIHQLEEQIRDFENLNTALETVWSANGVEEILQRIIEAALQTCHADQGSILLLDSENHPEDPEAKTLVREKDAGEEVLDYYLNRLLSGWVSHHRKSLLTHNPSEILGKANIKPKYAGVASILSFPMILQDKIIGLINLISLTKGKIFGEREERLVQIFASQCAQFIRNTRLHEELFTETLRLKQEVQDKHGLYGIIGKSPAMKAVFSVLERVIPLNVRVLLNGETGTGKERIARAIHYAGLRKDAPFIAVDCGALPPNLLESELFGYMKGAFTGADRNRRGLFEEAHGGTLFLDEINNMPLEIQAKFLRAIQEGEIRPLGASQSRKVDVRIISAASGDLPKAISAGIFREDLYYRLNVVNIPLPPLRERREDVPFLANHFLQQMNKKYQRSFKGISTDAMDGLEAHAWPGNVRELEHAVERAVVLCDGDRLSRKDFSFLATSLAESEAVSAGTSSSTLQEAMNAFKKRHIEQALKRSGGNQKKAAEALNIQRTYLNRLIKELGIEDF